MQNTTWDVVVVGGSAAGLSAALVLGRARRSVLLLDNDAPRNRYAEHMHGVLGMDGLAPDQLVARGKVDAERYDVQFCADTASAVEPLATGVRVICASGQTIEAKALVAASGVRDVLPQLPGLDLRWGNTVLHCPYCHGWEMRDRHLGVLALSDFSHQQALLVRQWSERVTYFQQGRGPIDEALAQELRRYGISVETRPVIELRGPAPELTSVRVQGGRDVALDALFLIPAPIPRDEYLDGLHLRRGDTRWGSLISVDAHGATSDPRVWAVGNIVDPGASVPQVIAAAAGAAMAINAHLVGISPVSHRELRTSVPPRTSRPLGAWTV